MSRIETMLTVIGEALVDVVHQHDGETRAYPGGSPMNVAVGARRLGHPTNFVGHYGPDSYGKSIDAHLEESQVNLPFEHSAERTSVAQATIGADGAAEYEFDITWSLDSVAESSPNWHAPPTQCTPAPSPPCSNPARTWSQQPSSRSRQRHAQLRPELPPHPHPQC